ncbi:hypothetical protein SprV_0902662900 [Sparganum proliferum]
MVFVAAAPSRIGLSSAPQSEEQPTGSEDALVARELARYKIDIAAPSETWFSKQGQLEEASAGLTFFWNGRPSADGSTLLTEKTHILRRWAGHFRGVLNRPFIISDAAIARLPQEEINADLDLPPSLHETIRAVQQLSSGKAPGSNVIPVEIYKHCDPQLMTHLTALFQVMWCHREVPQDVKDATIVHLYKRNGNCQFCDNHRGIPMLNIVRMTFARILLNRLKHFLEQGLLPESQCSFRRHRRTIDMIFVALQLQEKCQEMRTHMCSTFVDLTKAFDWVNRGGLGKIMQKFGCPEQITQCVNSTMA